MLCSIIFGAVLVEFRDTQFDGVGGEDVAGEEIEEGFAIGEGDGGDFLASGNLYVVVVFEVGVFDEVN